MGLYKIVKYIALALGLIGLILLGRLALGVDEETLKVDAGLQGSYVTPLLWVAYIVLALTVIFVILFVIRGILTGGNLVKTLISIGAFVAVFVIAYVMADSTIPMNLEGTGPMMVDNEVVTEGTSKIAGAGILMFIILAVVAIGTMIWGGVRKAFS